MRNILAVFVCISLFATPAAAEFSIENDTIARHDASGAIVWENQHGAVWVNGAQEDQRVEIVAPVTLEDTVYYGVGAWLVRANADTGVIESRTPFPMTISALEIDGGNLVLTVEHEGGMLVEDGETFVIRHTPGAKPPNETWAPVMWMSPWRDVAFLDNDLSTSIEDIEKKSPKTRARLADMVRARKVRDPTNAFHDWLLGALALPDDEAAARRAFEAAAANTQMRATSDIQLALLLDSVGELELADVVFDRGLDRLQKQLPGLSRSWSLVHAALLVGVFGRDNIERAVAEGSADRAHKFVDRIYRVFPEQERSQSVWPLFAEWLEQQGAAEHAQTWRARGDRASESPTARIDAAAKYFDLAAAGVFGCVFGAWLAAFILGARSRRRESGLPRPKLLEVAALLFVAFATIPLFVVMSVSVEVMGSAAVAPIDVYGGAWGSPESVAFLEKLPASEPRDTLLEHAKARSTAFAAGEPAPEVLPNGPELLVDAMFAAALADLFSNVGVGDFGELGAAIPRAEATIAFAIFPPLILFLLGAFFGRKRSVRRLFQTIVPGGSPSAGFLTPLVCAAFCAAVGAIVLNVDSVLQSIAIPNFAEYYGLKALTPDEHGVNRGWAWALLAAITLLHGATVYLDRADKTRDERPPD